MIKYKIYIFYILFMTSTRNKNTKGDYNLEQKSKILNSDWKLYEHSSYGKPYQASIPTLGYMPSHMSNEEFSNNCIDIESSLFGINSTNLVGNSFKCNPQLNNIQFQSFFEKTPIIMPKPLVILDDQRPLA
jgi:hypothetical protein